MYSMSGRRREGEGGRRREGGGGRKIDQRATKLCEQCPLPTLGISNFKVKSPIPDRRRGVRPARQDGRDRDDRRAGPHHPGGQQALRDPPTSHLRPHWSGRLRGESCQSGQSSSHHTATPSQNDQSNSQCGPAPSPLTSRGLLILRKGAARGFSGWVVLPVLAAVSILSENL